jgi:hypothetical protein
MLGTLISFFALAVAFGALWFAGEANKRAEFQHKKFYDSHIRGIADTMKVLAKTVKDISAGMHRIDKEINLLAEDDEKVELFKKISVLEDTVAKLQGEFEGVSQISAEKRPTKRRSL